VESFVQNQWSLSARITGVFASECAEPFRQNQWCLSTRIRTRETKEENLSDEAAAKAGRGILDHIAEFAGDLYTKVKAEVIAVVVVEFTRIAANLASKLTKSISSWIR
jgi:hypothetical protein